MSLLAELKIDRSEDHYTSKASGKRLFWFAVAVTIVFFIAWQVWQLRTNQPAEVSVAIAQAETNQPHSNESILEGSGYITARRQATVSSNIAGKIVNLYIDEGDQVKKGQILARLDNSTYQAQVELSKAQLKAARAALIELEVQLSQAKRQFYRTSDLFDKKLVSAVTLDEATVNVNVLRGRKERLKWEVDVASKDIALRQKSLEDTVIRAPFDAIVVSKDAQLGEMISPMSAGGGFTRTGICTLVDMESLEIEVDVNENYISRVSAGQMATATLSAYPDWRIPVKVVAIIPTADRQKATVKVRLAFIEKDARILPEMGVKVSFQNRSSEQQQMRNTSAIRIPQQALRSDEHPKSIYVVVDGRAQARQATLINQEGNWLHVGTGISSGEQVIVSTSKELHAGDRVTIIEGARN